jgi:hypothetical protein
LRWLASGAETVMLANQFLAYADPTAPMPLGRQPLQQGGALGSNVKGSSLPNCSGVPFCRNLALRALARWQASWIICAVAEVGLFAALVKLPADIGDVVVVVV